MRALRKRLTDTARDGEAGGEPENVRVLDQHGVACLLVGGDHLGDSDHANELYLLVPVDALTRVVDHVLEQPGLAPGVPLHELVSKLELLNHLAQMDHLLVVRALLAVARVLVLGFVLVLLVQEGAVQVAGLDPLQLGFLLVGDVEDVEVEGANNFLVIVQVDLQHVDEFVTRERLALCEQVVELE